MPSGSGERKVILAGLRKIGTEFATKEALEAYLKEHPNADKSVHSVKKEDSKDSPKEEGDEGGSETSWSDSKLKQVRNDMYDLPSFKDPQIGISLVEEFSPKSWEDMTDADRQDFKKAPIKSFSSGKFDSMNADRKKFNALMKPHGGKELPPIQVQKDGDSIVITNGPKKLKLTKMEDLYDIERFLNDDEAQGQLETLKDKVETETDSRESKKKKTGGQDRSALIRLASSMPSGSPERKAILAGLAKTAADSPAFAKAKELIKREFKDWSNEGTRKEYMMGERAEDNSRANLDAPRAEDLLNDWANEVLENNEVLNNLLYKIGTENEMSFLTDELIPQQVALLLKTWKKQLKSKSATLAGLKKADDGVDDLPVVDGGYFWEETDGGFALMKGSSDERGFIIDGGRSWLSYVPEDQDPIGRGQDSASDAAYQLMEHLRLY